MNIIFRIIKKVYRTTLMLLDSLIPLENVIIFESVPDLSDNTKAVFDEMIKRGVNINYKCVWCITETPCNYPQIHNVLYLNEHNDKKLLEYYCKRAKLFILCNNFIKKRRLGQKSIYLSHGTAIKSVRSYYNLPKEIDFVLTASKEVSKLQAYELNFKIKKAVPLGFPRNDQLLLSKLNINKLFDTDFKKIIVWYPTFRQHKSGAVTGSERSLPIIHNINSAKILNEHALKENIIIVLKPHFAQDVSFIEELNLSNIIFINDDFFKIHKISSYEFVGASDALITDYSSIYYDYTLCDKPIALILEDIAEYKRNPGIVKDFETYTKGSSKIYNIEDMCRFVSDVANSTDRFVKERHMVRDITNFSTEPDNSERVVDYLIDKFKLML